MTIAEHVPNDDDVMTCLVCGGPLNVNYMGFVVRKHDHREDNSGLDDGPWLPGRAPRKKIEPKSAHETAAIRARAWATRRAKYGEQGHR